MRVTVLTGVGCVVHLFVVYGYQGAEEGDLEKLTLTDRLCLLCRIFMPSLVLFLLGKGHFCWPVR